MHKQQTHIYWGKNAKSQSSKNKSKEYCWINSVTTQLFQGQDFINICTFHFDSQTHCWVEDTYQKLLLTAAFCSLSLSGESFELWLGVLFLWLNPYHRTHHPAQVHRVRAMQIVHVPVPPVLWTDFQKVEADLQDPVFILHFCWEGGLKRNQKIWKGRMFIHYRQSFTTFQQHLKGASSNWPDQIPMVLVSHSWRYPCTKIQHHFSRILLSVPRFEGIPDRLCICERKYTQLN